MTWENTRTRGTGPDPLDPGWEPEPKLTGRQVADLAAVALLTTGGAGLIATAFTVNIRLGWAALFTGLLILGLVLGLDHR